MKKNMKLKEALESLGTTTTEIINNLSKQGFKLGTECSPFACSKGCIMQRFAAKHGVTDVSIIAQMRNAAPANMTALLEVININDAIVYGQRMYKKAQAAR